MKINNIKVSTKVSVEEALKIQKQRKDQEDARKKAIQDERVQYLINVLPKMIIDETKAEMLIGDSTLLSTYYRYEDIYKAIEPSTLDLIFSYFGNNPIFKGDFNDFDRAFKEASGEIGKKIAAEGFDVELNKTWSTILGIRVNWEKLKKQLGV